MRRFGDWPSRRVTVNSVQANGAAGKSSGIEIQVIAHDLQSEHSLKSVACWWREPRQVFHLGQIVRAGLDCFRQNAAHEIALFFGQF